MFHRTPKSQRRVLTAGAIGALVTAALLLLWATVLPLSSFAPAERLDRSPVIERVRQEKLPSLNEFSQVWDKRLQGRHVSTAGVAKEQLREPPPPQVHRPNVVLLGTYDGRVAVFRLTDSGGQEVTAAIGDTVGGAIVEAIGARSARLAVQGTTFDYQLDDRP